MSLTKLIGNKTRAFVLGAVLTGCTYETYEVNGGEGEEPAPQVQLNNCGDWAARSYECNPEGYVKYMNDWGVSIEDQLKHAEHECNKGEWFTTVPEFITCYEQHSCDYIKAGNCSHYLEEAGF